MYRSQELMVIALCDTASDLAALSKADGPDMNVNRIAVSRQPRVRSSTALLKESRPQNELSR